jgi:hypothetical protein
LLTLVCIDALSSKAGRSQQSTSGQQPAGNQSYLTIGGQTDLPVFGSLLHRGATQ